MQPITRTIFRRADRDIVYRPRKTLSRPRASGLTPVTTSQRPPFPPCLRSACLSKVTVLLAGSEGDSHQSKPRKCDGGACA